VCLESLRAAFEIVLFPSSNKRMQFQEWLEGTFIAYWNTSFMSKAIHYVLELYFKMTRLLPFLDLALNTKEECLCSIEKQKPYFG
jgi:hypothetical protein